MFTFDNLNIKLKSGNLLEETHYYPFGLPIHNLGTAAAQQKENRLKYQSNEYTEDNDLRWMNFNARQYDPQIGRFLSIDPLAYVGGQQVHSPYAAMGNNPGMMVDPNGTRSKYALDDLTNVELMEAKRGDILGSGFSSTNVGGLKVSLGMNNTMLESSGGGGGGSYAFSSFGVAIKRFFSKFGNKASSNVEPSTGNSTKEESKEESEEQSNEGGGGHNLIVMFSGAKFSGDGTSETLEGMADELRDHGTVVMTVGSPILEGDKLNAAEYAGYILMYRKQFPGTKIYLYGYSYGGVVVNDVAKRLDELNIPVEYMAIVDAAKGTASSSINRTVSGNVKFADNFYQLTPERLTGSHGAPYSEINRVNNYPYNTSHGNMDEATRSVIINMMRVFINSSR